jgi:hypothetical protein
VGRLFSFQALTSRKLIDCFAESALTRDHHRVPARTQSTHSDQPQLFHVTEMSFGDIEKRSSGAAAPQDIVIHVMFLWMGIKKPGLRDWAGFSNLNALTSILL